MGTEQNMSAQPVDVRLARIAELAVHPSDDARNAASLEIAKREADEARAAVAEMVADVEGVRDFARASLPGSGIATRLDAALARVQGGQS